MKKTVLILLLALVLALTFAACDSRENPTEAPEVTPTEQPTSAPTEKPTEAPTEQPTSAPTEKPTEAPTEQPTNVPTEQPTDAPIENEGLEFTSNGDGTCYVSGIGTCNNMTSIIIPSISPNGDTVTGIGSGAFFACTSLTSIEIPDGITNIGNGAFEYCSSITSIVIPESVTSIGNNAFYRCDSLVSVVIADSVTSIGDTPFLGSPIENVTASAFALGYIPTDHLKDVVITSGDSITNVFSNSLVSIIIPDSIEYIRSNAFNKCGNLVYNEYENAYYLGNDTNPYAVLMEVKNKDITSYDIHENTRYIFDEAFKDCCNLVSVSAPNVRNIGFSVFNNCTALTSIYFPDVTSIRARAFYNCIALRSIDLPNAKEIGEYAFYHCDSLTSINIPNVTSIDHGTFSYCFAIQEAIIPVFASEYFSTQSLQTLVITGGERIPGGAFVGSVDLKIVVIPESITSIDSGAFSPSNNILVVINNSSLNITVGSTSFSSIAHNAKIVHSGDSKMERYNDFLFYPLGNEYYLIGYIGIETDLVLPENYKKNSYKIASGALSRGDKCSKILSIEIPEGITHIDDNAFSGCTHLTRVVIPNSVTNIGEGAFEYCTSLTSITIPNGITSIKDYTFQYCYNLTSVKIPDSVKTIGKYAFDRCTSLVTVGFGENSQLASIGDYAFRNCSNLASVEIPQNISNIGEEAFNGCNKLIEVINKSPLEISVGSLDYGRVAYYARVVHSGDSRIVNYNDYLFYTHNGENYLFGYTGKETELALPENFNGNNYVIYQDAFYSNNKITSIVIPNSVTSIGDGAFANCTNLTSVVIHDGVTSIGDSAFANCTNLTSIIIPDSITSTGDSVFNGCNRLVYNEYDNAYYLGNETNPYVILIKAKNYDIISCEIHSGTKSILDGAFGGCTNLKNVIVGNGIQHVGQFAFRNCYNLEYNEYNGIYYLGNETNPYVVLMGVKDNYMKSCEIHSSTRVIYFQAFYNCVSLSSIVIPDSVISIGDAAFLNCHMIKDVHIGSGVTTIGDLAFSGISGTGSIIIPHNVVSMGRTAFYSQNSITIYCEQISQPLGWATNWIDSYNSDHTVVWDYPAEE